MCPPGLACIDSQSLQNCYSLPSSAVSLQAGDTASCFPLHQHIFSPSAQRELEIFLRSEIEQMRCCHAGTS